MMEQNAIARTQAQQPLCQVSEHFEKRRKRSDRVLQTLLTVCAVLVVGSLLLLIGYILINGIPHISWELFTTEYRPGLGLTGIKTMIVSTLMLIGLTLVIATPIGILAAIYMTEYAKKGKLLEIIRFATESLSGIPSILFGLFGYGVFVIGLGFRYSILAGALTMSIMVLPILIRTTEQALLSVPQSYREGSLALGAGKLYTIFPVVLRNAISGILTSVILSVGRVVGETAAIIYTMGSTIGMPDGIMSSGRSLSVHLYLLAKEGVSFDSAFAVAVVLLVLVALINFLATTIAKHMGKAAKGEN